MSMIGGNADAIRDFARTLSARRDQIEHTQRRLTTLVEGIPWAGNDRERFLSEWRSIHQPNLARMLLDLGGVVSDAHRAAEVQDRASSGW